MVAYFDDAPGYTGETLDVTSRAKVRRMIDKKMRGPWSRWWVGVSNVPRQPLVEEALDALEAYWGGRENEACACFSACAVAEEIDFYLPKAFWKVKRKKRVSAAKTAVDPDWASFEKWRFVYPETRARLGAEAAAARRRAERYAGFGKSPEAGGAGSASKAGERPESRGRAGDAAGGQA